MTERGKMISFAREVHFYMIRMSMQDLKTDYNIDCLAVTLICHHPSHKLS